MEKKLLPYLVVISALSVSLSAAFYSVTGIGKMFSGSSTNVMIMMASLEIAKLILASLLYQYWSKFNLLLKSYYFIAIFVLMTITSAGIYGYLSAAYSETSNKVENIDKQVSVLNLKREMFQNQLNDVRIEKKSISENIDNLTKGLSNNYQSYKDNKGNILTTTSSANRKTFDDQLKSAQKRRDEISVKETILSDSISKIDLAKLDLETNSGVAQEIGPLKYIARITGKSTDVVVNWFIIALMLVFDPLAVSLVVGANVIFKDSNKEKDTNNQLKKADEKLAEFKKKEVEFNQLSQDFESRQSEIQSKEKELLDREQDLSKKFQEKENEIKSNLVVREKELEDNINDVTTRLEKLKSDEEKLKARIRDEEFQLTQKEEELIKERDELIKTKKELSELKKVLAEDKEELESESERLKDLEKELIQKQNLIENAKDELESLNDEIQQWENQHWKLKRNPPPSAIID